jgi:uncharacterized membrane protein YeaQ/YmgE (transglycosylase-associated protein family)
MSYRCPGWNRDRGKLACGGSGLRHYVITGLAGSLVGGFLLERFGIDLGIRNQTASRIATAMIGAIVVVLIIRLVS